MICHCCHGLGHVPTPPAQQLGIGYCEHDTCPICHGTEEVEEESDASIAEALAEEDPHE